MNSLYATVALLCSYVVAAKFRLDGGVDADFNDWQFACRVTFGRVINESETATCALIRFSQKYYAITVGHILAKTSPNTVNNLRIYTRYASIVSGLVILEFGSSNNRNLNRAVINVDENTLKLPLQFIDTLRDITNIGFAFDFLTIEIHNHQWYEQRNAKFLDIVNYGYSTQEPAIQCKIAAWGLKNGVPPASLQQTEIRMLHKDRCEFYFDTWADQYHSCISMSYIGDSICFETNLDTMIRGGDSGGPIMCEHNNKTVMVAIQVATAAVPIGGQNLSISSGAPMATIQRFLELIN